MMVCVCQATWHRGYWVADMTQACFTGWHLKWSLALGAPLLFLVCLVIPVLPALLLVRHRKQLSAPSVRRNLQFIYQPYK